MDQGLATVVATAIALVFGTLLGGVVEARRTDARIKTDREWQRQLLERQWERDKALATETRWREARLRHLNGTRDFMLAALVAKEPPDFVATVKDIDLDSIGDAAILAKFRGLIGVASEKRAEAGGAALTLELISAVNKQEERILRD